MKFRSEKLCVWVAPGRSSASSSGPLHQNTPKQSEFSTGKSDQTEPKNGAKRSRDFEEMNEQWKSFVLPHRCSMRATDKYRPANGCWRKQIKSIIKSNHSLSIINNWVSSQDRIISRLKINSKPVWRSLRINWFDLIFDQKFHVFCRTAVARKKSKSLFHRQNSFLLAFFYTKNRSFSTRTGRAARGLQEKQISLKKSFQIKKAEWTKKKQKSVLFWTDREGRGRTRWWAMRGKRPTSTHSQDYEMIENFKCKIQMIHNPGKFKCKIQMINGDTNNDWLTDCWVITHSQS